MKVFQKLTAGTILFILFFSCHAKSQGNTAFLNAAIRYNDSLRTLLSGFNLAVTANPLNDFVIKTNNRFRLPPTTERPEFTCGYFCGGIINLPVTGLELSGQRINETTVKLQWKTYSEINNAGFFIERMLGAVGNYHHQAFVIGAGNSASVRYYQFSDPNNFEGISYYRLRQTDTDSNYRYSNIVAVKGFGGTPSVKVFPNPGTNTTINFTISGFKQTESLDIIISDMTGRIIIQKRGYTLRGGNTISLNSLRMLYSGFYNISFKNEFKQAVVSFVVTE